jgi:hypothetical protein
MEYAYQRDPEEIINTKKETQVTLYKVCLPSLVAWPPGMVTLKVAFSEEEAELYIASYPNIFLRPFMKVLKQELSIQETD